MAGQKNNGDKHTEMKLRDSHKDAHNAISEGQLGDYRADVEDSLLEKLLEKKRLYTSRLSTIERMLDMEKAKFSNKYRNKDAYSGDINKLEEKRLASNPVEEEKYEPAYEATKKMRWWEKSKSPDGLKLAQKDKRNKNLRKSAMGIGDWVHIIHHDHLPNETEPDLSRLKVEMMYEFEETDSLTDAQIAHAAVEKIQNAFPSLDGEVSVDNIVNINRDQDTVVFFGVGKEFYDLTGKKSSSLKRKIANRYDGYITKEAYAKKFLSKKADSDDFELYDPVADELAPSAVQADQIAEEFGDIPEEFMDDGDAITIEKWKHIPNEKYKDVSGLYVVFNFNPDVYSIEDRGQLIYACINRILAYAPSLQGSVLAEDFYDEDWGEGVIKFRGVGEEFYKISDDDSEFDVEGETPVEEAMPLEDEDIIDEFEELFYEERDVAGTPMAIGTVRFLGAYSIEKHDDILNRAVDFIERKRPKISVEIESLDLVDFEAEGKIRYMVGIDPFLESSSKRRRRMAQSNSKKK